MASEIEWFAIELISNWDMLITKLVILSEWGEFGQKQLTVLQNWRFSIAKWLIRPVMSDKWEVPLWFDFFLKQKCQWSLAHSLYFGYSSELLGLLLIHSFGLWSQLTVTNKSMKIMWCHEQNTLSALTIGENLPAWSTNARMERIGSAELSRRSASMTKLAWHRPRAGVV